MADYRICLSTTVIRRVVLDNMGEWFDVRFRHIEEADLFRRIAYVWKFGYVYEPLAKNRIHKESSSYLRPDLSPKETEMMIEKFSKVFPDFEKNYKKEIIHLKFYVQYYYSLLEWKEGKNKQVRRRLKPFLLLKNKAIFPFLLSFFPYERYIALLTCYRKYIRRIPTA